MERVCERPGCDVRFTPPAHNVAKGYGRFCSRQCSYEARRKNPKAEERVCERPGCDVGFIPIDSNAARGWGRYCSKRCSALSTAAHEKRAGRMVPCAAGCGKSVWRYDCHFKDRKRVYCSHTCTGLGRWKLGDVSREVVSLLVASPGAKGRWLGRWSGRSGRPRGYTDEQAASVKRLREERPNLGIR